MSAGLGGRVVALVCRGSEADRAIAVELAEAGADIALATVTRAQDEEFGTASIANEIWAIGREQMNLVIDAADPVAVAAFAAEVCDRMGRCDALVFSPGAVAEIPFDELSRDEWDPLVERTVTAWLFCAQALGRVIERAGGNGTLILAAEPGDWTPSGHAINGALAGAVAGLQATYAGRGVQVASCGPSDAAARVRALLYP